MRNHTDTVTELLYTKVKVFVYPFSKRLNSNQKPSTQLQLSEEHLTYDKNIQSYFDTFFFYYLIILNSTDVITCQCGFGGNEVNEMAWLGNGICLFWVCSQWCRISKQFRVSHILTCSGLALSAVKALLLDKYRACELLLSHDCSKCCDLAARLTQGPLHFPYVVRLNDLVISMWGGLGWTLQPLNNIFDCGVTGTLLAPMAHFVINSMWVCLFIVEPLCVFGNRR